MTTSLYIHIPFCRQKCLYCDFYSVPYDEKIAEAYVSILLKEINDLSADFSTIYIGGGTPTILSAELFDKLLLGLGKFVKNGAEFTIEANPDSLSEEKLKIFIDRGVNRISIGAQSFDDKKLKNLGRVHNAKQIVDSIALAKKSGFKNISIDMIFGTPGEDLNTWEAELIKAAGSGVQHISCYSISYEKDTPLFKMRENKSIVPLDDEVLAEMYKRTVSYLAGASFERYEVSNFTKPGFECSHNLNYWDNNPYIGLGPSAVSYIDGSRLENIHDAEEYINRYENGISFIAHKEKLSGLRRAQETASVKIRIRQGIDYEWFKNKTGFDFEDILEKGVLDELFKDNLLEHKINTSTRERTGIMLTEKGFLFSDTVSSAFL